MKEMNHFRKRAVFFSLAVGLFVVAEALAAGVPRISKEELVAMMTNPDVIIIDVRLSGDAADSGSKIKGAVREDPHQVEAWMDKYTTNKTLVFYCA
jgi:hypothetical protein